jgi:hypothetical protein
MIDVNHPIWVRVRDHAEKEAQAAMERLTGRNMPPNDTEFERGRIAALRSILALAAPKSEYLDRDPSY